MEALVPFASATNEPPVSPSHRQSILGSLLRGRPRGASQSHQHSPSLHIHPDYAAHSTAAAAASAHNPASPSTNNPDMNPSSPVTPGANPGHRRRPAAGGLQASVSQGIAATTTNAAGGLSQYLRRRRSANTLPPNNNNANAPPNPANASNTNNTNATPNGNLNPNTTRPVAPPVNPTASNNAQPAPVLNGRSHRLRLVPHIDSPRPHRFDVITREVKEGDIPIRLGRFTDRSGIGINAVNNSSSHKLAFKSKVVSRAHAEVWVDTNGKFFIRDTKSSSGTFLNHVRLSVPNVESMPVMLKDGDLLQLGVDYQGGAEDIYKCVKMKIEVGREWQTMPNAFNTNAMKQIKALSGADGGKTIASKSGIADCCICLFSIRVHQSLFIPPCSHAFHYKCIRPLLQMHHPGFNCPLCRSFANLEDDVELDYEDEYGVIGMEGIKEGLELEEKEEEAVGAMMDLRGASVGPQRNGNGNGHSQANLNSGSNRNLPDVPGEEWMEVDYVAPDEREDGSSSMHHGPSQAQLQQQQQQQQQMHGITGFYDGQPDSTFIRDRDANANVNANANGNGANVFGNANVTSSSNHPLSNHPLSVAMAASSTGANSHSNIHHTINGNNHNNINANAGAETDVERDLSPRVRAVPRTARTAVHGQEDDDDDDDEDVDVDRDLDAVVVDEDEDEDEDEEMGRGGGVTDFEADADEEDGVVRHPVIPDFPGLGLGSGVRIASGVGVGVGVGGRDERGRSRSVSRVAAAAGGVNARYVDVDDDEAVDEEGEEGDGMGAGMGMGMGMGMRRSGRAASAGAHVLSHLHPTSANANANSNASTPTTATTQVQAMSQPTSATIAPTTTTTTHSERRQSWRRAIASITRPATADPSASTFDESSHGHGHAHPNGHYAHTHSHSPVHGRLTSGGLGLGGGGGGTGGGGGGEGGYASAAEGRNPFRRFVGGGVHHINNAAADFNGFGVNVGGNGTVMGSEAERKRKR